MNYKSSKLSSLGSFSLKKSQFKTRLILSEVRSIESEFIMDGYSRFTGEYKEM
jgi:hypothetical protein